MIDRKDPLNLHSFIFLELLKKTEITDEFIEQALVNNDRILGDSVYADTDSAKERKGENAEG